MKHKSLRVGVAGLLAFVTLFLFAPAQAVPITFIYTGQGQGSLGGTAFGTTGFTITATGDTDDRLQDAEVYTIVHLTASITIDGLGSFTFLSPTRSFVNRLGGAVGFSYGSGPDLYSGHDLFNMFAPAFAGWDMLTGLELTVASGYLLQWDAFPIETSGGVLQFMNGLSPATFKAVVGTGETPVPEPLILTLVGLGLAGVGMARRRRPA